MSKRRTIEDTMADAYDSSVARQQREEDKKNERAERLGGDTIEETMANVYDDIQDRDRKAEVEQSYEYGQSPTPSPTPEPEPKKWSGYDEPDEPDNPYDEPEDVYEPPKPTAVVQTYPESPAPVVKRTPPPSPEPEPEQDIYGPYADSNAFFSELMAQAPNPTPRGGRQVGLPAPATPGRQPRNPFDPGNPYRDTPFPWTQKPATPVSRPPRPPVVGQPMDWNGGNPWGNPYQVRPVAPRQPHPAQQPPPPVIPVAGDPFDWSGSNLFDNPYQVKPVAPKQPPSAQQPPPPVTPTTVTPIPPGAQVGTGTDSGKYDSTEVSKMTRQFLDEIHKLESNIDGYASVNGNALGRYQMTRSAREDAGVSKHHKDSAGMEGLEIYKPEWDEWFGTYGATSQQEFLKNPLTQELAMEEYMRKMTLSVPNLLRDHSNLVINGLEQEGILLEEGAILAAGHREGIGRVRQYLGHLQDHDGHSAEALTLEAIKKKYPELTDKQAEKRLTQFEHIETRLRQFQGIDAWKAEAE
ncbi:MAG: hypothetical protein HOH89_07495 [Alphaproteobacteria bacterium]|jgi:hypothetical protein|nr:hypothetical protein [Alphaproteobacteria bacterium]